MSCPLPGYSLVVFAFPFLLFIQIIPLIQFPCFAEWAAYLNGSVGGGGTLLGCVYGYSSTKCRGVIPTSASIYLIDIWLISGWYQKRDKLEIWNRDCIYFHLILLQYLVVSQGITGALLVSDNDPVLILKPYMNPGHHEMRTFLDIPMLLLQQSYEFI